jgi:phenylacetate-CoA ligase
MGYKKGDIIIGSGGTVIAQELRDKNIFWIKEHKNSVWGEYDFSVLYITDYTIKYYIEKLIEIKPVILRGYPSFYDKLATYIIQNNIKLDFNIKGINLTAEMCSVSQRINIEKAFSTMVYFEYGHTEICLYCYTSDDSYIYKSSPIYGYIEVLDDDGIDAKIGEIGNIIVTGFNNYGMPFVRYDTGDMGELIYRNGGEVHFKKIHGRNQDYIISKDKQKVYLTALIFGQHLEAFKSIKQWQLRQDDIGIISIYIIKQDNYTFDNEKEILNNFQSVADIDLIFNYVDNIALTKRGKHLFLIQNIGKNNDS